MLVAINFHYVREIFPKAGIIGLTPAQFRHQMEVLSTLGSFVSGEQIGDHVVKGSSLPEVSFIITFDDGLTEQYEMALPIMDEMGIPGLFFVNTVVLAERKILPVHKNHILLSTLDFEQYSTLLIQVSTKDFDQALKEVPQESIVAAYPYDEYERGRLKYFFNYCHSEAEKSQIIAKLFHDNMGLEYEEELISSLYMNSDHLSTLAHRGYLGTHSHSHIALGLEEPSVILKDMSTSLDYLKKTTGIDIKSISYPYGSEEASKDPVAEIAASLGLVFGFTMERKPNYEINNPLLLSRFDTNDVPGDKYGKVDTEAFKSRFLQSLPSTLLK